MGATAVAAARRIAEEVLLPDAAAVDAGAPVPAAHLRALDESGLTGLGATDADLATRVDVTAALAGGCLATAFVWLQHQGALAAVSRSALAGRYEAPLASGALRAGVAITGLRPPAPLTVTGAAGDLRLVGEVPWVTGWGAIDLLRVAAHDERGAVRSFLLNTVPAATMVATPTPLAAARSSATVTLRFDGHPVQDDRLLDVVPLREWEAADAAGLAQNGALALGIADRCARLGALAGLTAAVEQARDGLVGAATDELPAARAACSALAARAAAAFAVAAGSRGVLAGSDADRLTREAAFLLAFGTRPAIRADLLRLVGA